MYLNRLRLKQDNLVIERKETGESLYDFADGCINLDVITWIKFKNISSWISAINTYEQITHKHRNRVIYFLITIYGIKIHKLLKCFTQCSCISKITLYLVNISNNAHGRLLLKKFQKYAI